MDAMQLSTNVVIEVHEDGRLVRRIRRHNLVVLAGRNAIRDALNGTNYGVAITAVAVGTGTTAPDADDGGLVDEVDRGSVSQRTITDGSLTVQRFLTTGDANGSTLTEAGIFLADGTLLARVTFPGVAKTAGMTVTITWAVNIGSGS